MKLAVTGQTGVMPIIKRISDSPYKWKKIETAPLKNIANVEKTMPKKFISKNGFEITSAGKYLRPFIQGEAPMKYQNGLPEVANLKKKK